MKDWSGELTDLEQRPASTAMQCEVRAENERCQNEARFVLSWRDRTGLVCADCLGGWLWKLTERGGSVVVERLGVPSRGWRPGGLH